MPIRPATAADLPTVAAIYAHEAATGISTFDLERVLHEVGRKFGRWIDTQLVELRL